MESATDEQRAAQARVDELESGTWFEDYTLNNTEPCGPHSLTFCLPCWRAEVADAKADVTFFQEYIDAKVTALGYLEPVAPAPPNDEPETWTSHQKHDSINAGNLSSNAAPLDERRTGEIGS